ncbi:hypothetical protein GCM10022399_17370 [Terrabacter ginsenosidimutans]|uniref:Uncharacterized protein n=1 Tax=Terrabacter ginsenosidimutans TaxID=490575 RepID=A0ABP7D9V6_9MICO
MEEDVDEVGQHGDPDHEQEDVGEHASCLGRGAGARTTVDPALTALDAFLTTSPLESGW